MKRLIAVVVLVMMALSMSPAFAYQGTATCIWTPPSAFEDGRPLIPSADLDYFNVKCGSTPGGPYPNVTKVPGGASTQVTIPVPLGTVYCVVTSVSTTVNGALESANSPEGSKTITAPRGGACKTFRID